MDQQDIKHEVQVLWLQYAGLETGLAGNCEWIDNAACKRMTLLSPEKIFNMTGLMVAT